MTDTNKRRKIDWLAWLSQYRHSQEEIQSAWSEAVSSWLQVCNDTNPPQVEEIDWCFPVSFDVDEHSEYVQLFGMISHLVSSVFDVARTE